MRLVEGVCGEMRAWAQIGLMAAGMVTLGCTEGRSADPGEWTLSKHILLATGIRTDGQLAGVRIEAQRTPVELVVDTGGVIVRTEQVYGPSSPLLDALDDGKSLQEAVAELTASG